MGFSYLFRLFSYVFFGGSSTFSSFPEVPSSIRGGVAPVSGSSPTLIFGGGSVHFVALSVANSVGFSLHDVSVTSIMLVRSVVSHAATTSTPFVTTYAPDASVQRSTYLRYMFVAPTTDLVGFPVYPVGGVPFVPEDFTSSVISPAWLLRFARDTMSAYEFSHGGSVPWLPKAAWRRSIPFSFDVFVSEWVMSIDTFSLVNSAVPIIPGVRVPPSVPDLKLGIFFTAATPSNASVVAFEFSMC